MVERQKDSHRHIFKKNLKKTFFHFPKLKKKVFQLKSVNKKFPLIFLQVTVKISWKKTNFETVFFIVLRAVKHFLRRHDNLHNDTRFNDTKQ